MELGSLSTTALNQSLGKSLGFLAWFSYLHNEEIELDSFYIYRGSIGGSVVKNPLYHFTLCRRHRFDPWARKILWRRTWQPTPVYSPWGPSYSPWDHKRVRHDLETKQQHVSSNLLGCNSLLHLDHRLWSAFLFFPFDLLPFHFLLTWLTKINFFDFRFIIFHSFCFQ